MARIVPNENTWIGFIPFAGAVSGVAAYPALTAADLAGAVELTGLTISVNASARGNTVPTPALDSLFETSVPGTSAATFDADFYRDDVNDLAWETLTRGAKGHFVIQRYGNPDGNTTPAVGADVEVWPVQVTSRTMANMSSNTALTFSINCAVNVEPVESVTVAA